MATGVLAIQGDFARHLEVLAHLGEDAFPVRSESDLARVERLIVPGGESTTVAILLRRFGLDRAIVARTQAGMPIWGTCMGMILMASSVEGRSEQFTLGLLDVEVRRNAFGAQVHSFTADVAIEGEEAPVSGAFIRAPVVTRVGPEARVIGRLEEAIVAVEQGTRLGTSFHPELTDDATLHRRFLALPTENRPGP